MLVPIGKQSFADTLSPEISASITPTHFVCVESNGSGKTSLAMAALWALTGSMDPRRSQDGKVSDVVNDQSKVGSDSSQSFSFLLIVLTVLFIVVITNAGC